MKYLLDTNGFREIGKNTPHPRFAAWYRRNDDGDMAISAMTVRETTKGILRLRERKPEIAQQVEARVVRILDAWKGRILPIDRAVAEMWGELLAQSEKHVDDACLAATARVHRLVIVTRNTADFAGRGVQLLDPFRASPRIESA